MVSIKNRIEINQFDLDVLQPPICPSNLSLIERRFVLYFYQLHSPRTVQNANSIRLILFVSQKEKGKENETKRGTRNNLTIVSHFLSSRTITLEREVVGSVRYSVFERKPSFPSTRDAIAYPAAVTERRRKFTANNRRIKHGRNYSICMMQ